MAAMGILFLSGCTDNTESSISKDSVSEIESSAVQEVPPEESDEYFRKRPYKSRVGARISPQSQPITSRMQLIRSFVREAARWIGKEVERPDNWGGYAVTPTRIEFWQGRPNRLHDRFLYTLQPDGEWKISRLAP